MLESFLLPAWLLLNHMESILNFKFLIFIFVYPQVSELWDSQKMENLLFSSTCLVQGDFIKILDMSQLKNNFLLM